jgi:hypothetical protein
VRDDILKIATACVAFAQARGTGNGPALKSVYDFAHLIAAREKCPSFAFSSKLLYSPVLIHHPPMPICVIRAID